jgi:hypothetical protein
VNVSLGIPAYYPAPVVVAPPPVVVAPPVRVVYPAPVLCCPAPLPPRPIVVYSTPSYSWGRHDYDHPNRKHHDRH